MNPRSSAPAFPAIQFFDERPVDSEPGLSRQELIAAMLLQGLLSAVTWDYDSEAEEWFQNAPADEDLVELAVTLTQRLTQRLARP